MNKYLEFELGLGNTELGLPDWSIDRLCHIPTGTAILAGAGISGASSLAGGKKGSNAALQAAQIQAQYEQQALAQQKALYQQNQTNLNPFMGFGTAAMAPFSNYLSGTFAQPIDTSLPSFSYPGFTGQAPAPFTFQPTAQTLNNIPGYQYQRQAGIDAGLGAAAATGGKVGSTSINNITDLANSMAGTNWQNYFNSQYSQYQAALQQYQAQISGYQTGYNAANQTYTTNTNALLASRQQALGQKQQTLAGLEYPVGVGLSAAGAMAGSNIQAANTLGNTLTGIGASLASGQIGSANALTGSFSGLSQAALTGAGQAVSANTAQAQLQAAQNQSAQLAFLFGGGGQNFNPAQNTGPMIQGDMGQTST